MKRDRVIIDGTCIDVMHSGKQCKNCVLYFYGFPGSIGVNALTEKLVSLDIMVLQPHFPGTYDSAGSFDPFSGSTVLSTVYSHDEHVCKSVKSGKDIKILKPSCVYGHSFGAFAALEGVYKAEGISKLVLLAPAISFKDNREGCGLKGEDVTHYDYVKRSRPYTYRLSKRENFEKLYSGKLEDRNRKAPVSLKKVVGIVGEEDKYFDRTILSNRFEGIIKSELVGAFDISLHVVPEGTHSLNTLIDHTEVTSGLT
jgi:hypothetical protein